jgi:ABC-type Zn uptake system ZnuABC Zn-binding protein ZnuA
MTDPHRLILRLAAPALLAIAAVAVAACGDDDDDTGAGSTPATERLAVVTTILPITALAEEVGGGLIELNGIVPAGADAHDFEPVASDLVAIEEADLILRHGVELDEWLDDTIEQSDAAIVTVTEGIEFMEPALAHGHGDDDDHGDEDEDDHGGEEEGDDHSDEEDEGEGHSDDEEERTEATDDDHADDGDDDEHGGEGELDPHVWHDPDRAMIMVDNIATALAEADPDNAEAYATNAQAYKAILAGTRDDVQAIIDEIPEENRKLVTNHDAFGYFADAFGLEIVGAVIPGTSTESEPSAAETAELLETIEELGVKAIFAESSVNAALATQLAEDAGVQIVDTLYGDSLGEPGSESGTVHGMLLANARTIADALT